MQVASVNRCYQIKQGMKVSDKYSNQQIVKTSLVVRATQ